MTERKFVKGGTTILVRELGPDYFEWEEVGGFIVELESAELEEQLERIGESGYVEQGR